MAQRYSPEYLHPHGDFQYRQSPRPHSAPGEDMPKENEASTVGHTPQRFAATRLLANQASRTDSAPGSERYAVHLQAPMSAMYDGGLSSGLASFSHAPSTVMGGYYSTLNSPRYPTPTPRELQSATQYRQQRHPGDPNPPTYASRHDENQLSFESVHDFNTSNNLPPSLRLHPDQILITPPFPTRQPDTLHPPSVESPSTGSGENEARMSRGRATKTGRQQFTACGACRYRRVKCDLRDRQDEAERLRTHEGPLQEWIKCSNCHERELNCVDEFAPIKAAKRLRRGKRITQIENRYGKVAKRIPGSGPSSPTDPEKKLEPSSKTPELSAEFFESAFFRRFNVQRPILEPTDFTRRYLSFNHICAANLGVEGALLCHVLYAWAVSYGVDEHGQLDIPDGGGDPLCAISLIEPGAEEIKREEFRQKRFRKMESVVGVILDKIDAHGLLRKPSWDGVRVLLLVLPLTEGISTPVERLAMYEAALSQVFMLCSHDALDYNGQAAGTSGINGGSDERGGRDMNIIRIRTYWYAFVHEGITTGLKGGRLLLDSDDIETIQDSISSQALVYSNQRYRSASAMAAAPINLALACRLINRALTGPAAKRRTMVPIDLVKQAWEALEESCEEFESMRNFSASQYASPEDIIRYVDGWKIFIFEAQNVIRTNLETRLVKLVGSRASARISDPNGQNEGYAFDSKIQDLEHLLDIAKNKCEVKTRQILQIVRKHLGTAFFEWDASLVRDGLYYVALLLAQNNGSQDDIGCCIQALNEVRWAHAKAWSRSADLRREWATRSAHSSAQPSTYDTDSLGLNTGPDHSWTNSIPRIKTEPSTSLYAQVQSHKTTESSSSSSSYFASPTMTYLTFEGSNGDLTHGDGANPDQRLHQDSSSAHPEYAWNIYPLPMDATVTSFGYDHDPAQFGYNGDHYRQQQYPSVMVGYQQMPPPAEVMPKGHEQVQAEGQQGGYGFQGGNQNCGPYNQGS